MSEEIQARVRKAFPWALLPYKERVETRSVAAESRLLAEGFRWLRKERAPELCKPYRVAAELGWFILSPIDVTLAPLDDVEITSDRTEVASFAAATGHITFVERERSTLAISNPLRAFDFRGDDGWQPMFIPNGGGTLEWKQGWTVDLPADWVAMLWPIHLPGLWVIPGVLSARQLRSMAQGISIAVRPISTVSIHRGQRIAKLLIAPSSIISAKIVTDGA